jgi:aspartate aminotransferase
MVQLATGWAFPTATLQYAVAAFERLSIDLETLERKRDRMVAGLRGIGYRVHVPEGTFYVLPEAPNGDAVAFTKRLERHGVLVLAVGGRFRDHFRISLTATEETVERSFAGFRASFEEARH